MANKNFTLPNGQEYVTYEDFGYTCYFPNLIIDNPTINGIEEGQKNSTSYLR